jgi:hypothetical protein
MIALAAANIEFNMKRLRDPIGTRLTPNYRGGAEAERTNEVMPATTKDRRWWLVIISNALVYRLLINSR